MVSFEQLVHAVDNHAYVCLSSSIGRIERRDLQKGKIIYKNIPSSSYCVFANFKMQLDYSIWPVHEHRVNVFWLDLEAIHLKITLLDNL